MMSLFISLRQPTVTRPTRDEPPPNRGNLAMPSYLEDRWLTTRSRKALRRIIGVPISLPEWVRCRLSPSRDCVIIPLMIEGERTLVQRANRR